MTSQHHRSRWMLKQDAPQVLAIEEQSFSNPMDYDALKRLLARRTTVAHVIEADDSEVIGFMIYRICTGKVYELIRLCIKPEHQGRGHGRALLNSLKNKLTSNRRAIGVKVHERALAAQLFLKALGFTCIDIQKQYGEEDIYLFEFDKYRALAL